MPPDLRQPTISRAFCVDAGHNHPCRRSITGRCSNPQTVAATGEIPQLQTDKTDVATVFSSRTVGDLPIYKRNFTTLQLLPGAQRLNWGYAASENPSRFAADRNEWGSNFCRYRA